MSLPNPRLWSVQCLIDWLTVREHEGHRFPSSVAEFCLEVDHSALLLRLMHGQQPLAAAPPLSYGKPWYDLIEDGLASPQDVWVADDRLNHELGVPGVSWVVINDHHWRIMAVDSHSGMVVSYGDSPSRFSLTSKMGGDEFSPPKQVWTLAKL